MPTHFSKLEGSQQRERMRRRRMRVASATGPSSFHFDESVGSNTTLCEVSDFRYPSSSQRSRVGNIPQVINVQNSKRLPKPRNRPPQHDAYCQTRVSVISSFPSRDGHSNRHSRRIEREQRDEGKLPLYPARREHATGSRDVMRRLPENTNKNTSDQQRFVYDLTSISDPSEPSTLTNSSSVWGPRAVHNLVNSHGVFGSNSVSKKHQKELSSARRRRPKNALDSVRYMEQSITESYGYPYSTDVYASSRRKNVDDISYDSQNELSLIGVRFADTNSESNHPLKRVSSFHGSNGSGNGRTDNFRQQQKNASRKWLCDVCREARFETYVEAYRHEAECRKNKMNTSGWNNTSNTREAQGFQHDHGIVEANEKISTRRHRGNYDYFSSNYKEHVGSHLQEMSLSSSTESPPSNHCRIDTTPISRGMGVVSGNNVSMVSREDTRWLCSVCEEVSFDNYPDACVHEKICKIRMEATADLRAAGIAKPASANAPTLPHSNRPQTRGSVIDLTEMVATVDLWKTEEEKKRENHPIPPSYRKQQTLNHENLQITSVNSPPENRQDENSTKSQIRYEDMDIIERQREGYSQNESSFGGTHPEEVRDDQCHASNGITEESVDNIILQARKKKDKGEAYDRYVLLASQQEEEEERERYIALAKQTREEEFLSYRQADNDGERYVCLA